MKTFRSYSSRETAKFASDLAGEIFTSKNASHGAKCAAVVALHGNLGAGKTTFAQGFAKGLGIKRRLISPTFVIMRRYALRGRQFKNLYHIDAYRIKKSDALETLGLKEILADLTAIILIEWPENVKNILPHTAIRLKFQHGKKETERTIKF